MKNTNTHYFYRLFPLLLLIFIDSFSFFVVIPVLLQLFYSHHLGLLSSATTLTTRNILTGVTIALSPLAALFAAPLIGQMSDKYGRKKTLIACIGCVTVGFIFPIIGIMQKNIIFILVGRFIAGIGSASQPVAQAAVADLCKDKNKSIFFSLIALMMTLALIVGPLAGGYLSDSHIFSWFNLTTPYVFACGLSVLNLMFVMLFFKETKKVTTATPMLSVRQVFVGLPSIIKKYDIGILLLAFFLLELGWSQYYQSISLFLHVQSHETAQKISLFNAYMGIAMSIGLLLLYPLWLRFFSVKKIMIVSILCVMVSLCLCAFFSTSLMQWIFVPGVAVFTGCGYVSLITLISNKTSSQNQGLVMGYLSTILYLAWMLTAFNGGFLISWHNSLPIYCAALFLVVACISIFNLKRISS